MAKCDAVVTDLEISGSSLVVKMVAKGKNIRLTVSFHGSDCKIDGIDAMG